MAFSGVRPNRGRHYLSGGGPFVGTKLTRFLDTRDGLGAPDKSLGAGGTLTVKVAGVDGVPTGASAVLVNLTGVAPTANTHLTAYGERAACRTCPMTI